MKAEISDEEKVLRRYAQIVWDLQRIARNHPTWSVTWRREGTTLIARFGCSGGPHDYWDETCQDLKDTGAGPRLWEIARRFERYLDDERRRRLKRPKTRSHGGRSARRCKRHGALACSQIICEKDVR